MWPNLHLFCQEQVQSNKDLDLPTQQELLAQFRCDEIAHVALEQFATQIKPARKPIESGKVIEELGKAMRSWRDEALGAPYIPSFLFLSRIRYTYVSVIYLVRFDREASRYHAGVYQAKRAHLLAQLHASLSPLFLGQLKNLHKQVLVSFRTTVLEGVKGDGYDFGVIVKDTRKKNESAFVSGASGV